MQRTLIAASAALVLGAGLAPAQSAREAFRLNTALAGNPSSNNANNGRSIARLGKTYLAVWADQNGTTDATEDIYAAISRDDGFTWSAPSRVDVGDALNLTDSNLPRANVTTDPLTPGGLIYFVTWEDSRLQATPTGNGAGDDCFGAWSTDGVNWTLSTVSGSANAGAFNFGQGTWGQVVQREVDEINSHAEDGNVYVVWEEDGINPGCTDGDEGIFFSRSIDGGRNFSMPQRLNQITDPVLCDINDTDNTWVHADGQLVVVGWCDEYLSLTTTNPALDDVAIAISNDGGLNLVGPIYIEDPAGDLGDVDDVRVYVEGQNILVYYQDDEISTTDTLAAMLSVDGGQSWSQEMNLSPATTAVSGAGVNYIEAVVTGSRIYACFVSDFNARAFNNSNPGNGGTSTNRQLYVSYSPDLGASWTTDIALDPTRAGQECALDAAGLTAVVAAQRNPFGTNSMAFFSTLNGGTSWKRTDVVSTQGADVDQADTRDSGRTFVFNPQTRTGMSILAFNRTGMNEPYVCGFRTPGLALNAISSTQQTILISGVASPTPGLTIYDLWFSASGTTPGLVISNQCLNLVIDGLTVALIGTVSGQVNAQGEALFGPFPTVVGSYGVDIAGIIVNLSTLDIQITDPIRI
jgi:hypothetical protein